MKPFKKYIATLVTAAVASTGLSAPAQAEVTGEELAAILLGGAVIYSIARDRNKKDANNSVSTSNQSVVDGYTHRHGNQGSHFHAFSDRNANSHRLQQQRERGLLSNGNNGTNGFVHSHGGFGRHFHKHGVNHSTEHGRRTDHAVRDLPLPDRCERQITVRNKVKDAYRANCLRRAGYEISNNGTVRHDRWPGRKARPILVYR